MTRPNAVCLNPKCGYKMPLRHGVPAPKACPLCGYAGSQINLDHKNALVEYDYREKWIASLRDQRHFWVKSERIKDGWCDHCGLIQGSPSEALPCPGVRRQLDSLGVKVTA